jgi:hypothetical protein
METLYLSDFDDDALIQEISQRLLRRFEEETGDSRPIGNVVFVFVGGEIEAVEEESGVILYQYS